MKRYNYLKILYPVLICLVFCLVSSEKADCGAYSCGGYSDTCSCGASNPHSCSENGCSNCTWWAWYKACCEWGKGLPAWGRAINWWYAATGDKFSTGSTPRPNSIFVAHWSGWVDGVYDDWGHVGWVTQVYSDGSFDTVEQIWGGWSGTCGPKNFYGNTISHLMSIGNSVIGFIYGDFLTYITPDTQKVYWIQNNKKYWVKDEGVLNAMQNEGIQGWSWSSIYTVSHSYNSGPDFIAPDSSSNGLLIRQTRTDPVYVMVDGEQRWITSQEALKWKGTDWNSDVIEVSSITSSFVPTQGNNIYGLGEGETDQSIKSEFIDAYNRNENDSYCASSSDWKGWPGKFSKCLGFPTTPVGNAYNSGYSGIQGKYQQFDYTDTTVAAINWTSQYGAFAYHGAIGKKYSDLGFSSSGLGFPKSDEYQWGAYRRSDFEGGYIYWDPNNNQTYAVMGYTSETISAPTFLSGPENGNTGMGYAYSTGDSSSNLGHSVQYLFDWGDGTNSGWLPIGQTGAVKSWSSSGFYLVRAQARCSTHTSIVSPWSIILSVNITCATPSTPTLSSPSNEATGISTTPTLDWSDVSGATSYDVQVCSDSGCASVVRSANVASSQWTVSSALNQGTQYYWRVRANNSCGSGSYTSTWSFTTAVSCIYSLSPTSRSHGSGEETGSVSATTRSNCTWTATSNAAWITITSGSSRSGNGTVNYSVSANRSASSRSGTLTIADQTFTVNQAYTGIGILVTSPDGGEVLTAGTMQTIRWSYTGNVGSSVKVELLKAGVVNRTITSSASAGRRGIGSYRWRIPSDLAPGADYQVRVTSTSNSGYTDVSDNDFTIKKGK